MKKTYILAVFAFVAIGLVATSVYAFSGNGQGKKLFLEQENQAVQEAILANDYAAYLDALDEHWNQYKAQQTQEEFQNRVEQRQLAQERKTQAQAHRLQKESERLEQYQLVKDACATNNPSLLEGSNCLHLDSLIETDFEAFCSLHTAIQNKDVETIEQIVQEKNLEMKPFGLMNNQKGQGKQMFQARNLV